MKKILLFFSFVATLFLFLLFGGGQVFAQTVQKTPEEIAKEKGITFPIQELGNCQNFNDCRNYCEDPVNRNTCIDFAKSKGFHREESTSKKEAVLKSAITELGCNSEDSCKTFCSQEANHDKCFAFAKKYNLGGGQVQDPSKGEILNKAKEVLGCNSYESCRSFCENPQNSQKCSEFARQVGLRGGEHETGPGGCTSEETCKAFCSDPNNYQICSGFTSSTGGKFSGPGGCDSEASCRAYCQSNPAECGYKGETPASYDPVEMCNKTPNCSWTNNTCQCQSTGGTGGSNFGDYEKFCRENPEKCAGTSQPTGSTPPPGGYNPPPSGGYSTDPATGCAQAGGSWVNGSCQFSGTQTSPTPSPAPSPATTPNTTNPTPAPTSSTSQPTGSFPDPASECTKTPGCTWTGSTCSCGGVQGASTTKNLFQSILEIFLRL